MKMAGVGRTTRTLRDGGGQDSTPLPLREPLNEKASVLVLLRVSSGLTEKALAEAMQIPTRILRRYERGVEVPSWAVVLQAANAMCFPLGMVYETRISVHEILRAMGTSEVLHQNDPELSRLGARLAAMVEGSGRDIRIELASLARNAAPAGKHPAGKPDDARRRAGEIWEKLRERPPLEWGSLPGRRRELRRWAVCERLCEEILRWSSRLEESNAGHGRWGAVEELSNLALRIACLLEHGEKCPAWHHRLCEFTWAHVGNVRRAAGNLAGAEEAFFYATEHYQRSYMAAPAPLDASRPFLLEALLRRDQGRFADALALVRIAETLAGASDPAPHLLAAEVLLRQRDLEGAAAALARALEPGAGGLSAIGAGRRCLRCALELAMLDIERGSATTEMPLLELCAPLLEGDAGLRRAAPSVRLFMQSAAAGRLGGELARLLWETFLVLSQL